MSNYSRTIPISPYQNFNSFSMTDRLCARALVFAFLDFDYEDLISLARAVARSEEKGAA